MKNEDLVKLEGAAKCLGREVLEECRFFVEYSEGRPASRKRLIGKIDAALSAPCPAAPDPSPEAWAELVGWAYSKDNGAKYIQEITAHYNAMLQERNRLRAELAEANRRDCHYLCPVCDALMQDPPRDHNICGTCMTHFAYEDWSRSYDELRREWERRKLEGK